MGAQGGARWNGQVKVRRRACTLFVAFTSAPFSTRGLITAGWLFSAAQCSGVYPYAVVSGAGRWR